MVNMMIKNKKRNYKMIGFNLIMIISVIICYVISFVSCDGYEISEDAKQTKLQQETSKDARDKIRINITRWTEKKQLANIYELRDKAKLMCYLYTRNEYSGKYVYEGRCQGFGINYATQFSNPERPVNYERELDEMLVDEPVGNLPQPEPNDLFMPESSTATWVTFIDAEGKEEVQYVEPEIVVTQSKKRRELCEPWSLPDDY